MDMDFDTIVVNGLVPVLLTTQLATIFGTTADEFYGLAELDTFLDGIDYVGATEDYLDDFTVIGEGVRVAPDYEVGFTYYGFCKLCQLFSKNDVEEREMQDKYRPYFERGYELVFIDKVPTH